MTFHFDSRERKKKKCQVEYRFGGKSETFSKPGTLSANFTNLETFFQGKSKKSRLCKCEKYKNVEECWIGVNDF